MIISNVFIFTISLILFFKLSTSLNLCDNEVINADYIQSKKAMIAKPKFHVCTESDDCAEELNMFNDVNEVTKRKHKHVALKSIPMNDPTFSYFPPFHHQQLKFCSCGHEKRLADLGPQYFPRYISDMACIPGGCGNNYVCRPKRFKLWVMRKRQEDEEPGTEPIPKELRELWVGESIVTTIDCECAP